MPTYNGDDSDNTIAGTNEDDVINGLGGDDRLSGSGGADTIDGGAGNDRLFGGTEVGPVTLGGDAFIVPQHFFSVIADTSPDVLRGGSGYDYITAGYGDTVDGGGDGGILHVSYLGAPHSVTEGGGSSWSHITATSDLMRGWVQGSNFADTLDGNWILGMGGDDHIYTRFAHMYAFENYYDGGDGNDLIETSPLNDDYWEYYRAPIIFGGAGDDTIVGGGVIDGGLGNDVIRFTGRGTAHGAEGNDNISITGNAGSISGGTGADVLIGGAGNDTISTDRAIGFDGNNDVDHVNAGAGNDMIFAGYGDVVNGGAGFDTLNLSYIGAPSGITGDTKVLFAGQPLAPGGGTVQNIERFDAVALTQFADTMVIGDQADPATAYGYGGNDHLIGQENRVVFYGGEGHDLLVGSTANDELYGENGDDKLIGHRGSDDMWGGAGADAFYFTSTDGTDRIHDFQVGVDKINVAGVDANTTAGGHQTFSFVGSASFSKKAGELRVYQEADGKYIVAGDVNGDGLADLLINLGSAQVGVGDFVFV